MRAASVHQAFVEKAGPLDIDETEKIDCLGTCGYERHRHRRGQRARRVNASSQDQRNESGERIGPNGERERRRVELDSITECSTRAIIKSEIISRVPASTLLVTAMTYRRGDGVRSGYAVLDGI